MPTDIGAIITAVAALLIMSVISIVVISIIKSIQNWSKPIAMPLIADEIVELKPVLSIATPIGIIVAKRTTIGHSISR